MITIVATVLFEEAFGPHHTYNLPAVLLAYGGYIVTPFVVMARFWNDPAFTRPSETDKKRV
jgi:hypothetical protein